VPPEVGNAMLWTDGANRYRYRINLPQFSGFSQGLTVQPKP